MYLECYVKSERAFQDSPVKSRLEYNDNYIEYSESKVVLSPMPPNGHLLVFPSPSLLLQLRKCLSTVWGQPPPPSFPHSVCFLTLSLLNLFLSQETRKAPLTGSTYQPAKFKGSLGCTDTAEKRTLVFHMASSTAEQCILQHHSGWAKAPAPLLYPGSLTDHSPPISNTPYHLSLNPPASALYSFCPLLCMSSICS